MGGSIAEINIDEQLFLMLNNLIDGIRVVREQIESKGSGNTFAKVNGLKNANESINMNLANYLVKVKGGLEAYDLYIEIGRLIEKASQNLSAISYRLSLIFMRDKDLGDALSMLLTSMVEMVIQQAMALSNAVKMLSISPAKVEEITRNVVKLEEDVDDIYRNSEVKVFEANKDLIVTMLLKDVIDRVEDTADLMREIAADLNLVSYLRS